MRIANELYLKRLIVGGFDGVYEFSKISVMKEWTELIIQSLQQWRFMLHTKTIIG